MTPKLLTRLTDALKDAWDHKWSQAAMNERLSRPDGSGNRRLWSSRMRGPRGRWSTQAINERLDAASRRRQP